LYRGYSGRTLVAHDAPRPEDVVRFFALAGGRDGLHAERALKTARAETFAALARCRGHMTDVDDRSAADWQSALAAARRKVC